MARIEGVRSRARAEVTAAIKEEARRQLAEEGAARLSLRAVARELGMVSSALYRYFPGRDELLTELIVDAYSAAGSVAESAASASAGSAPAVRWREVCRALRRWALAHPHEYALVYGSPVPGYAAPDRTTEAASRIALALFGVVADAVATGDCAEPVDVPPAELLADARELGERIGLELPAPLLSRALVVWPQLFGLIGFEVFGQLHGVIERREAYFDHAVDQLAATVGLSGGRPTGS
ncbi:TetR/AcrR family transcriptional regulator [Streptomyces sp. XM4193]|uniref:TetR/AcrR family transcriptional regulator n=1 Tax=Streptomyces sp. XM4193 TaxID=2929782 RepID=UPI001FFB830B|nr:TetR/AcrR family transcriptional regulator [Streptomyces sp. XM4193]MCK1797724.1 TetR/AcrR family transcriptional regulator [Streptomyces sp. XM4193]